MHNLLAKYSSVAYFLCVYIVEAHAIDEWPVGDPLKVSQPLTTSERVGVARAFVNGYHFQLPMLVDTIDNCYSETFAAWPIRFFVVENGKILFKAQPDEKNTYDSIPPKLDTLLAPYLSK